MHIILRYNMNALSAPRSSLRSFLASAKTSLHNAIINQQRVTLVIGNEAADLDSITSAIVLAYFRSSSSDSPLTNTSVNKHTPPSQYPPLYIPVINIPRADIKIRTELLALLPEANLDPSHLITLDDLAVEPPAGLNPTGKEELQPHLTRVILVDHNRLVGPLRRKGFGDRVVGCIDHHVDEHSIPIDTGKEPRIIEKCGSCTSLVTRYCRPTWDALSGTASAAGRATAAQSDADTGLDDDAVRRTWDAQIAKFAIASVVIDTHNLKDKIKTTEIDEKAVTYLDAKICLAPGGVGANWDRQAFYDKIHAAKEDLSDLSPSEILRKDYKHYEVNGKRLGISSVVTSLASQVEKAGGRDAFLRVIRKYRTERSLDFYAIMTTSNTDEGGFRRELLLNSHESDHSDFAEKFPREHKDEIGSSPWKEEQGFKINDSSIGHVRVWWLKPESSRKVVAPLMCKAMKKL